MMMNFKQLNTVDLTKFFPVSASKVFFENKSFKLTKNEHKTISLQIKFVIYKL